MDKLNPIHENILDFEFNGEYFNNEGSLMDGFELFQIDSTDKTAINTVQYIKNGTSPPYLTYKQNQSAESSYNRRSLAGLFLTFLNKTLFN